MRFKFIEFNSRRAARGAPAARVEVDDGDGGCGWLWMDMRDIRENIKSFGLCAELNKAKEEYSKGGGQ